MERFMKFICALFLTLILIPAQKAEASTGQHTVNVETILNVREKPSSKAKVVGSLKKGTVVYVYNTEPGGWSKIKYKNKAAYVASSYLNKGTGNAQEIAIPDQALRQVILENLNKSQNVITKADMEKLVSLDLYESGVINLKGLEYAKNLTTLDLTYSGVIDSGGTNGLTSVAGLPKLKTLYVGDAYINKSTGASIAEMRNLTTLSLVLCSIDDISFVYKLPQLKKLDLSSTNISKSTINQIKKKKPGLIIQY